MPVDQFSCKDGIFYARESGLMDASDARLWAEQARQYAEASPVPIVALVDAMALRGMTAEARQILAEASAIPNLYCGIVATDNFHAMQNARLTSMMALRRHTHLFESMDEARRFAEELARELHDRYQSLTA